MTSANTSGKTLHAAGMLLPVWWNKSRRQEGRPSGTVLRVKIGNPANPKVTEIVEFTVDSSAAYSIVPAAVLKRLGVRPFKDEDFVLADGTTGRRKVGAAFVQQDDRIGCANVIFGEVDDRAMLGTLTLPMIWGRKRRAP